MTTRILSGQGFVNLDLQSASVSDSTSSGTFVSISDAIPGWTGYLGDSQQATVLYNALAVGSANLALLKTNNSLEIQIPAGSTYLVVLQAGYNGGPANVSASIAQTGWIPSTANSILFTASFPYASGWQLMIGGQVIPVSLMGIIGNYGNYTADVSSFAGQVEELRFVALPGSGPTVNLYLTSITFSSIAVPEPNVLSLSALGGLLLAWRRWRKPRSS